MDRSPLFLAALASAAVPGLDPASVEALTGAPDHQYDVAFVQDTQHRRWVVRVPRTQAASAQMESTFGLLALLARRLPFGVPTPKGFAALKEGGRAAIYPYLPGQNIDFSALPAGPGLAAELGRAIAALHNADHGLFDEAGLPAYDADTYRTRRLSELDRAAATGHVPTGLLSRWEKALEDVSLWRFAPTPTHGDLTGDQVLVVFDDEQDVGSGRVKAITGWEDAKVADPADDFFALATQASPAALETVMEAYAHARSERPDANLLTRARLRAEMRTLAELMAAVAAGDQLLVERHSAALRRLDERVHAEQEAASDYRRAKLSPARRTGPVLVPPQVVDEDDEVEDDDDVDVMFARTADRDRDDEERADEGRDEERADEGRDEKAGADHRGEGSGSDQGGEERTDEDSEGVKGSRPDGDADDVPARARSEATGGDDTAEIDLRSPLEPGAPAPGTSELVDGEDPGPEFEPGYSPAPDRS